VEGWRKSGNLTGFGFVHDGANGVDGIDPVDDIDKVNPVNSVNRVNISLPLKFRSQLPSERPVQQRLLQRLQRGELAGVEAGEALGFFAEGVEFFSQVLL
jgi:hypothetical protein